LSQPLTVVLGYAELLREQEVPSPELLDEAARSIQRGSQKMAGIVRQLSSMGGEHGVPDAPMNGRPATDRSLERTPRAGARVHSSAAGMLDHAYKA